MENISTNISLKKYNSFGIDVKTNILNQFTKKEEIIQFILNNHLLENKYIILGEGNNVLFTKDFEGITIIPNIKCIEIISEDNNSVIIKIGAGENWDEFVEFAVNKGYSGIENLSHIPGTVGSSPIQNIGAYGVEVKDVIEKIEAINISNAEVKYYTKDECQFDYRSSIFKTQLKDKVIITAVIVKLNKKYTPKLQYGKLKEEINALGEVNLTNCRKAVISIRVKKLPDPKIIGNAGSFFKNPIIELSLAEKLKNKYPDLPVYSYSKTNKKISAAWLIEQCGWKGKKIGNTGTHKTQALVIVNYGNASGKEILNFSKKIQTSVYKKFTVKLEPEVNII